MAIRKTVVLAWAAEMGHHDGIYSSKFIDFGIVLPAGVTPTNWNPDPNNLSPMPQALDRDHYWGDFHGHPNLMFHRTWDPTSWKEPDGSYFFGWRLENRDENLDRYISVAFEWDEIGGPDVVLGAVLPGVAQVVGIGVEPPNDSASIVWRPANGNYGDPVAAKIWQVHTSRWQMQHTDPSASAVVGRITANHLAMTATHRIIAAGFPAKGTPETHHRSVIS